MTTKRRACDYCGLVFTGTGYGAGDRHYCCCGCYLAERIVGDKSGDGIASWILIRLGVGAFLSMNVMMISLVLYASNSGEIGAATVRALRWIMLLLSTPAVIIQGIPFIAGATKSLRQAKLSTDMLIATGSVAAFAVSAANVVRNSGEVYFDTATMLLFIVTLGRLIEAAAKNRTSASIRELVDLTPAVARVIRDGIEQEIPSSEVREGDLMIVRTGERIPSDGEIASGECLIEESAFTGESRPRSASPGDRVYGGSVNCDGLIEVHATAVGGETLLSRIHDLVHQAQTERAPIERLTERVSTIFVPLIWLITICCAAYWAYFRGNIEQAAMSSLAVLVVACPCALGLATPMATCIAIGKAARAGVLIRSGEVLEALPGVTWVFFDKTGTLTDNNLTVTGLRTLPGESEADVLTAAASLESACTHSIARAVVAFAGSRGLAPIPVENFRAIPGRGVTGTVKDKSITVGSLALIRESHQVSPALITDDDLTATYIGWEGHARASFTLADTPRPESSQTITRLNTLGLHCALISGDQPAPTARIARDLGITDTRAELTPEQKADAVRAARDSGTGLVAMVGDGINDAPALAEADVGVATGTGTDLAREASDVTLLGDDLSRIPWTIELARRTYSVIRRNLFWAFFYNCIAVVFAFFGYVHPLLAASAMVLSSFFVIGSSLSLLRADP